MGKRNKYNYKTRHHIIPQSREREGYDVRSSENFKLVNRKTHEALHNLFSNKTPYEQLKMWFGINSSVLSDKVVKDLVDILLYKREEFYKNNLLFNKNKNGENKRGVEADGQEVKIDTVKNSTTTILNDKDGK